MRVRHARVCALTVREGPSAQALGDGPGVGRLPKTTASPSQVAEAARAAAAAAHLQLLGVVVHRPTRITPEIVLLARDPNAFQARVDRFEEQLLPMFRRLDAAYVEVRDSCGKAVWFSAESSATGAGGTWADRHWICPFGDLILQHCPAAHASASDPCL